MFLVSPERGVALAYSNNISLNMGGLIVFTACCSACGITIPAWAL